MGTTSIDPGLSDTDRLAGRIRKALYGVIDHYAGALTAGGGASFSAVHSTMESRMPVSADVLDARDLCCSRLAGWALLVLEERDLRYAALHASDAVGLARFLVVHADWLAGHEAAKDALEEIASSSRDLKDLDEPRQRDWLPIGECPVIVGDDPCGATVRAYTNRHFIACSRCGTEDTLAWWMSQIVPEGGTDLAAADTAIACVVSETFRPLSHEQLRQWATRGYIRRHGKDHRGRTLYSSRALLAYARDGHKELELLAVEPCDGTTARPAARVHRPVTCVTLTPPRRAQTSRSNPRRTVTCVTPGQSVPPAAATVTAVAVCHAHMQAPE